MAVVLTHLCKLLSFFPLIPFITTWKFDSFINGVVLRLVEWGGQTSFGDTKGPDY